MTREVRRALEYQIIESMGTEQLQKLQYDKIGTDYESHYGDPCRRQYRERFIHQPTFAGLDLRGLNVLEAMCGNGQTTEFLLSQAKVAGLDISLLRTARFVAELIAAGLLFISYSLAL